MTQEEKLQKEIARIVSCEEELNYFENKGDLIDFVARHFYEMGKNADETIRKELIFFLKEEIPQCSIKEHADKLKEFVSYLEKQKEQKTIKMEVYEIGKGTTICGQDYKCKKDYKEGNCWYIKDVIYHCSRDGYLNDQNGVNWSCTPEWFNEYIYTNSEWADKEKNDFVSGQFIQCKLSFDGFKEGEHYWLEYVGDDMYVGRSDNILNQKFHITPGQLFTLFSQKLEEVQGPPQEGKQVSLNYEPPFDENPSDNEIIEALIKHLKEQDGFLTAIDCVSTKAILRWLEKQKDTSQELEQEDEKMLDSVIRIITQFDDLAHEPTYAGPKWTHPYTKELAWLKSLSHSWKPSEEQMEALESEIKYCYACGLHEGGRKLQSLYEQLKKLM